MPTLMELQKRLKGKNGMHVRLSTEEVLIDDVRGQMRPGQIVESKLRAALQGEGLAPAKFAASRTLSN